jgi:predicted polyphosphate/ATP-dependent NAD kinase
MDIYEDAFRRGSISAKLCGYLRVPYEVESAQPTKGGSSRMLDEKESQQILAEYIVELMEDDWYYVLGPGTTMKSIADKPKTTKTLLGVDLVYRGKTIASDLNEQQLLRLIGGKRVKIIVSPIGQQGFIFGTGNQQISPRALRKVGVKNILVLATKNKLSSIRALLVDTGDDEVDRMFSGYRRIITGYKEAVAKVAA